jgi:hypothetical protein
VRVALRILVIAQAVGCSTEVVELAIVDASVPDAGPADPRDAGEAPRARLVCPDTLVAGSGDTFRDAIPDSPLAIEVSGVLSMSVYGADFLDARGFGFLLRRHTGHGASFASASLDGVHIAGPMLARDGDAGFVVAHHVRSSTWGELIQLNVFRAGERSERYIVTGQESPVWDVAYVDQTFVAAIGDPARPRLEQFGINGRPVGFGEAPIPSGAIDARLAQHGGTIWLFTRSAANANVVVGHRLVDGEIVTSVPFDACGALLGWDVTTNGDDAFVALSCADGGYLMATTTTERRALGAQVMTPRIAFDGAVIGVVGWAPDETRPNVRFAAPDLTAIGAPLVVPLPTSVDEPGAVDIAGLEPGEGWAVAATSRKGDGWIQYFDGCVLEAQ